MIIELTEAEMIILFDFLYKNTDCDKVLNIENKIQRQVLWNLECLLEKQMHPEYDVEKAEKEMGFDCAT